MALVFAGGIIGSLLIEVKVMAYALWGLVERFLPEKKENND